MSHDTYRNGVLVERRDDTARTVTRWDGTGTLIPSTPEAPNPRPYSAIENSDADTRAAAAAIRAERGADRAAVRAILDTINAQLDEARAAKAAAQAVIDATAPTNVAQCWAKVKDNARAIRDTDNALVGIGQGVKDIARLLKDSP